MPNGYIKRLFDDTLLFALKSKGAVVVEGPKWCGKSTTCKRYAKEIVDLMPIKTRDELILEAKLALDFIRTWPCGKVEYCSISYEPENEVARELYRSLGFMENGEMDGDEIVAVLRL